jgi:hypothetical protein
VARVEHELAVSALPEPPSAMPAGVHVGMGALAFGGTNCGKQVASDKRVLDLDQGGPGPNLAWYLRSGTRAAPAFSSKLKGRLSAAFLF